ncbi:MAG: GIY-YIG nuclease family protein [Bacteroidota bacterium]|nr:GIY-YIG nuclease family protein [Bacteroidota bacterium]
MENNRKYLYLLDEYKKAVNYPNHLRLKELQHKFLYLIKYEKLPLFKIGITNTPNNRFRNIENTSGLEVHNLLLLECQYDYDEQPIFIEHFLHEYFNHKRTIGEWFTLSIRDVVAIRNLIWYIEGEMIWDNVEEICSSAKK